MMTKTTAFGQVGQFAIVCPQGTAPPTAAPLPVVVGPSGPCNDPKGPATYAPCNIAPGQTITLTRRSSQWTQYQDRSGFYLSWTDPDGALAFFDAKTALQAQVTAQVVSGNCVASPGMTFTTDLYVADLIGKARLGSITVSCPKLAPPTGPPPICFSLLTNANPGCVVTPGQVVGVALNAPSNGGLGVGMSNTQGQAYLGWWVAYPISGDKRAPSVLGLTIPLDVCRKQGYGTGTSLYLIDGANHTYFQNARLTC
jgi:hypothetical protein